LAYIHAGYHTCLDEDEEEEEQEEEEEKKKKQTLCTCYKWFLLSDATARFTQ
jgi:hypothetical protein